VQVVVSAKAQTAPKNKLKLKRMFFIYNLDKKLRGTGGAKIPLSTFTSNNNASEHQFPDRLSTSLTSMGNCFYAPFR